MRVVREDGQKWLKELRKDDDKKGWSLRGGEYSALRAYQAYHPNAAIYTVSFYGRTFWLTAIQHNLWMQVMNYHKRGTRTTLEAMAGRAMCSRATVSRFLKRLDLWRVIDCATIRGRTGGTYILTRLNKFKEADANLSGARHTYATRKVARQRIAEAIKRLQIKQLEPLLTAIHATFNPMPWYAKMGGGWLSTDQATAWSGSTDATFR